MASLFNYNASTPTLQLGLHPTAAVTTSIVNNGTVFPVDMCAVPTTASNAVYAAFFICVIVISVVGNAFVCAAVLTSSRLRARKTNHFILSLAVSDIVFSLVVTTTRASSAIHNQAFCHSLDVCRGFVVLDGISTTASITCLFIIAIDRYLAVCLPYKYPIIVTSKRAVIVIAGVWLYACVWASLSTFNWLHPHQTGIAVSPITHRCVNVNEYFYATSLFLVYFVPLVVMAIFYLRILNIAFKHARAIRATAVEVRSVGGGGDQPLNGDATNRTKRKPKSKRKSELKATKTVAIVYGTFLVCWLPLCIIHIIMLFKIELFINLAINNPTAMELIYYLFIEILPVTSAAVNPFIYSVSSRYFREGFKQLIWRATSRFTTLSRPRGTTMGGTRRTHVFPAERETSFVELDGST